MALSIGLDAPSALSKTGFNKLLITGVDGSGQINGSSVTYK